MNDEQRKPVWPWIVAALFALPVLYVLELVPGPNRQSRDVSSADASMTAEQLERHQRLREKFAQFREQEAEPSATELRSAETKALRIVPIENAMVDEQPADQPDSGVDAGPAGAGPESQAATPAQAGYDSTFSCVPPLSPAR